jgi:site-specific recombinase XerD
MDHWRARVFVLVEIATAEFHSSSQSRRIRDLPPFDRTEAGVTLREYVENVYFPALDAYARPSTIKGYRDIWRVHLSKRVGSTRLRDFSTRNGRDVMMAIAGSNRLARTTIQHIKSALSAIFTFAQNDGLVTTNPIHGGTDAKPNRPTPIR